eukprot:5206635-Prymnesium_polylepis.2
MSSAAESLLGLRRPLLGLEADAVQQPHLWLGVSSYCTPTHCDDADNLILLLCGSKRLWITPPNSRAILQPTCIAQQCWANLLNPTDNHARDDVVESNGWFHFVQNLEPTVMVNVWTAGRDRVAAGAGRCASSRSGRNQCGAWAARLTTCDAYAVRPEGAAAARRAAPGQRRLADSERRALDVERSDPASRPGGGYWPAGLDLSTGYGPLLMTGVHAAPRSSHAAVRPCRRLPRLGDSIRARSRSTAVPESICDEQRSTR